MKKKICPRTLAGERQRRCRQEFWLLYDHANLSDEHLKVAASPRRGVTSFVQGKIFSSERTKPSGAIFDESSEGFGGCTLKAPKSTLTALALAAVDFGTPQSMIEG